MRAPLTTKQREIYDFIAVYIANHKQAPYIREIQEACQINSYKSVVDKLLSIEKKGYIRRRLNKHRSIKLVNSVVAQAGQPRLEDEKLVLENKAEA